MKEEARTLKVDQTKLMTQSAYARKVRKSRGWINQQVKAGTLTVVEIEGAKLILID